MFSSWRCIVAGQSHGSLGGACNSSNSALPQAPLEIGKGKRPYIDLSFHFPLTVLLFRILGKTTKQKRFPSRRVDDTKPVWTQ
jgi:hypothetical protein